MAAPTVLICIGATKAGTTWVYDYLRTHPDCHMQAVKELHYFDTKAGQGLDRYVDHAHDLLEKLSSRRGVLNVFRNRRIQNRQRSLEAWRSLLEDPEKGDADYLAYLMSGADKAKLVADITPCYQTLGEEDFAKMVAVAPDVRFLFLMRDPIDRAWSQARMNGKRRAVRLNLDPNEVTLRNFKNFLDGRQRNFMLRSNYQRTIEALEAAAPGAAVHYEFFEHLFTPQAVSRLTAFLGIAPKPAKFDRVSHEGRSQKLPADLRARAAELLAPQYAFCARRFGDALPERWTRELAA